MNAVATLTVSLASYGLAGWVYATAARRASPWGRRVASTLFAVGFAATAALVIATWEGTGRPPFKSLFQSLLLLACCVSVVHLVVERIAPWPPVGAAVSVAMMSILGYALAHPDLGPVGHPPALQSPWFIPHVVAYFAGYGTLLLAAVLATAHLTCPARASDREPDGDRLRTDRVRLMHALVVTGFLLLTAGLVLGSFWAREAWGAYWAWDPKENWALISWLTYVLYFHLRRLPGWNDRSQAWMILAGLAAIGFTYLGIQWLPTADSSVHVYR